MKNSLLRKSASIVLTAAVLLSTAGFKAITASAESLGAATVSLWIPHAQTPRGTPLPASGDFGIAQIPAILPRI